jgi:hypothetical protein
MEFAILRRYIRDAYQDCLIANGIGFSGGNLSDLEPDLSQTRTPSSPTKSVAFLMRLVGSIMISGLTRSLIQASQSRDCL